MLFRSVRSRDGLSMAYTPGVARVCMAIHDDPERAWDLTIKGNSVMVVSDGSALVGQGDLGLGDRSPFEVASGEGAVAQPATNASASVMKAGRRGVFM